MAAREALIASADPGTEAAEELCALTDEAVSALAVAASPHAPKRWALVALGGYGAGRLLPASDLDLLVLCDEPAAKVKPFVQAVLYPLWDAGLAVGHQVRSRRQQLAAVRADTDTLTATLNGRALCGDTAWAEAVLAECAADAQKRSRAVLRALASRERPGSPYLLEPDLKDGAGGQRDLDELGWTASVLAGWVRAGFEALVDDGLIDSGEESRLVSAAEKITAARWDLQRARPRNGSLLALDTLDDVRINAELVQSALADAHHLLLAVRRRIAGGRVPDLRTFASPRLFELLDRGEAALPDLEEAAWEGRLEPLVPGLRALMATRRPGIGHTLTVGAHTLRTAVLVTDPGTGDPTLARSLEQLVDRRVLQVAAMAHDLGKASGGPGHAERGAPLARDIARRLQLDDAAADAAETLVREHLLLAETAATEDIDDEDTLLAAAARIGDRALVPALHLLTAADSLATGPGTWTPWHAALVGALVARLDAALAPEIDGAGVAERGRAVREGALTLLPGDAPAAARSFVGHAPLRYLASRPPEAAAADAMLVADLTASPAQGARTAVRPGPLPGTFAVSVAAPDRPELFSRVAGAITLAGLDILAAGAHGAPDGLALDSFTVRSATGAPIAEATWAALDRFLTAALADRFDLETRLAQRARDYAARPARVRPRVTLDSSRGWATAVTVRAADRVGLLHDVAREISAEGLDIRWANVVTRNSVALDTFHVVDASGQALDDPGVLGHLSMRLRGVL